MLSIPHLLVIFVVVLVVFGPHKLPELARGLGKLMAEFRKASTDFKMAFEEEMRAIERQARENEFKKAQAAASAATPAALPAPATGEAETEHTIHQPTSAAEGAATEAIEPVVAPVAESVPRGDGSVESVEAEPAAVPDEAQPAPEQPADASGTSAESAATTHDSR